MKYSINLFIRLSYAALVVVVISGCNVTVPNVVGLPELSAQAKLIERGLTIGNKTTSEHEIIAKDCVISQNPAAGEVVMTGSRVDLVLSLGKPKDEGEGEGEGQSISNKIVFARGSHSNARPWICGLDGKNAKQLVDLSLASYPKIANNNVVFMSEDYENQGPGIYSMQAAPDASILKIPNTENISNENGLNWDAIDISPDGSRIVWAGPEEGDVYPNHNVYVINLNGTEKTRILRDTGKHYFTITWGEANRICVQVSNVGNSDSQRPYTVLPDGSGLTQVVQEFAQNVHVGGPKGHAIMTWTKSTPYLVKMKNDFTNRVEIPGPRYGYTLTSWHPLLNVVFGCHQDTGNLYSVDLATGNETLLFAGGELPCFGGDVGTAAGNGENPDEGEAEPEGEEEEGEEVEEGQGEWEEGEEEEEGQGEWEEEGEDEENDGNDDDDVNRGCDGHLIVDAGNFGCQEAIFAYLSRVSTLITILIALMILLIATIIFTQSE